MKTITDTQRIEFIAANYQLIGDEAGRTFREVLDEQIRGVYPDATTEFVQGLTLLPCPFCQGEARAQSSSEDRRTNLTRWFVICTKCATRKSGITEWPSLEEAVDNWNRRTDLDAVETHLR